MLDEVEETPDVVTSILKVFDFDVYALLDPDANLSFVTPFQAIRFYMCPEILLEPLSIYTPIAE